VNGLSNRLRGKPFADPLIPAYTYDLDEVLAAVDQAKVAATHIVFEHQQELSSAIVFAHIPLPSITGVDERGRPLPGTTLRVNPPRESDDRPIDVKTLVDRTPIEELNQPPAILRQLAAGTTISPKPFQPGKFGCAAAAAGSSTLLHGAVEARGDRAGIRRRHQLAVAVSDSARVRHPARSRRLRSRSRASCLARAGRRRSSGADLPRVRWPPV
jgi:hypothetical protein